MKPAKTPQVVNYLPSLSIRRPVLVLVVIVVGASSMGA